jgi:two-component SAPR family response regulator
MQRTNASAGLSGADESGASPLVDKRDCPVHVYTLGRFSVSLQRQSLTTQSASRYQRPFEMLQILIALGGRDVHAEHISQALWPDADGDRAQNAFDVTLHRLRQVCEVDGLLLLRERRLTLNSELAWVDAWSFERLVNHCERLLGRIGEVGTMEELLRSEESVLRLYQGAFLEREAQRPWAIALRERLRSKLLRHLGDAGQALEAAAAWDQAIRYYQKGLEVDPLVEVFYRRLMHCFRETDRIAEALTTFARCRAVLAAQLQITPAPDTVALYRSISAASAR